MGIALADVEDGQITAIYTFLMPELFVRFGLPVRLGPR